MRIAGLVAAIAGVTLAGVTLQVAAADEIRHTTFTGALLGKWAQTAGQCAANDRSNFAISEKSYAGPDGTCGVEVIVETAGAHGPDYSVRGRCPATSQSAAQTATRFVNMIIRRQSADRILIGTSFDDLKPYQRCPAN